MDFFDYRLPTKYSLGAVGGPQFSTETNKTVGGSFFANRNWLLPLHAFDISQQVQAKVDFEIVRALFYNVYGQFSAFRFKHFDDFTCDATNSSLTVITGAIWQLNRIYALGSRTFVRPIYKPCTSPAVVVTRTRSGSPSTATASIDYATGQATITGHVAGDTYTWAGQFDVPVGFTTDKMEATTTRSGAGLVTAWPNIILEERRP